MKITSKDLETIEEETGLHERFHMIYLVDCYEVSICDEDNDTIIYRETGESFEEALRNLAEKIRRTE
jgi:hypothetical protein